MMEGFGVLLEALTESRPAGLGRHTVNIAQVFVSHAAFKKAPAKIDSTMPVVQRIILLAAPNHFSAEETLFLSIFTLKCLAQIITLN